ncbi:unnamed protein product, partial [Lampetra fluviatilis]
ILPAAPDDNALVAFTSIPLANCATFKQALRQMAAVFGPPSHTYQLFDDRKHGGTETPLAYRCAFLVLATIAYPSMDDQGIDALVIHKMLRLPRNLQVVVNAFDDSNLNSLHVARCIQANVILWRDSPAPVCAATTGAAREDPTTPTHHGSSPLLWPEDLTDVMVEVPPGEQMLIPLRYRKPLRDMDASA